MCSYCKLKYKDFLLKHEETSCPFKQSLFCPSCAECGHSQTECPDPPPIFLRPIDSPTRTLSVTPKPLLELLYAEESLKAFLRSKALMPLKALKLADLVKLVRQYADKQGYELSLIH